MPESCGSRCPSLAGSSSVLMSLGPAWPALPERAADSHRNSAGHGSGPSGALLPRESLEEVERHRRGVTGVPISLVKTKSPFFHLVPAHARAFSCLTLCLANALAQTCGMVRLRLERTLFGSESCTPWPPRRTANRRAREAGLQRAPTRSCLRTGHQLRQTASEDRPVVVCGIKAQIAYALVENELVLRSRHGGSS